MKRLYTYEVHINGYVEEIDVEASSELEAYQLAKVEALRLYGPDAVLVATQAGGSGGLVQW